LLGKPQFLFFIPKRAVVSPEHLPLPPCHGGCDKMSWLPEGKVFSNVQREKIITKFLKESVLKRVFRSKQMRWDEPNFQKEDLNDSIPGTKKKTFYKHKKTGIFETDVHRSGLLNWDQCDSGVGTDSHDADVDVKVFQSFQRQGSRRDQESAQEKLYEKLYESCNTALHISTHRQPQNENLPNWSLDSEVPVPENKNLPPGRDSASGGTINKNHLEIPVDQLMLELNLSEHAHRRTQNSKQGIFQLWSYPLNEGNTVESRDFKISSVETGFNVSGNPMRLFALNHSLTSAVVDQQAGPYPGLQQQMPLGLCWPYADGDFFKDRNETHINLSSAIESSSSETLSALNWNFKYANSSVEENLTDESDLSENEKANDTLLNYFKKMDLNLKPETIENFEESFTEEPSEVFPYPDFLPPPFNTLDLHKLALSKSENWKATMEPPESSVEHLITRLLEMERIQHMTIQKERTRLQTNLYTPAVTERPSSSKAIPRVRQPKLSDSLSLQTSCVDKSREKRKNNSGSCKLEQNVSKWNWSHAGKYRWNSRATSLKSSSTTKQLIATCDDFKNPKNSILNPCQEFSAKPSTAQTTQSLVKMVSTRCLPTRSPIPISPVPLTFPENQREE
uniref:Family with sequence similarity 217 member A n=1 Tax=Loxodonta africana TaxID=9785 RepID=G3UJM5_LOXAF